MIMRKLIITYVYSETKSYQIVNDCFRYVNGDSKKKMEMKRHYLYTIRDCFNMAIVLIKITQYVIEIL